jgi:hypothetical protein
MGKGGGSPAPAPSSQTVTQTSIPEYARPYVENMLGKSEALTDIGANPYQAYGGQRIQDFTPMQQQAFQGVGNMQVAPEIGAGSNLAALSGLGSIGAGGNYMSMATDPRSIQSFMSPYMQNVVDMQKQEATRDYQKGLGALNARAVGSGAFGGTRAALERSEAGRNLGTQLANIQAQGSQNAFQAAQQAQQYGAGLGLQGMGQGLQAASTLGQLGQTGFGQRMGILGEQQKVGAVQQAQGQQALDLGYQDFLKQKNYPYQQLAYMSDMLRGLPLSQSAQQVYTAPPNVASQLGGLGMAGLGIYGMSGGFKPGGMAEGGSVKGYKDGGSIGYLSGGEVEMMSTDQLEQLLASPNLNPLELEMIEKALMARRRMEMNPQAGEMMARSGIGAISTGDMVPEEMAMAANGGIIAFSKGGKPEGYDERRKKLELQQDEFLKAMQDDSAFAKTNAAQAKYDTDIASAESMLPYRAMAAAGFAGARGDADPARRNFLSGLGTMGEAGLGEYSKGLGEIARDKKTSLQQGVEAEKTKYARNAQLYSALTGTIGQMDTKELTAESNRLKAEGNLLAKNKDERDKAQNRYNTLFGSIQRELNKAARTPTDPRYKKYKADPDLIDQDAEKMSIEKLSPEARELLGKSADNVKPVVKPAANTENKGPFVVTVPGKGRYTFPTQEAADEFKKRANLS